MAIFGPARKVTAEPDAARRLKGWTRQRFGLDPDAAVFVTEAAATLPGCPPIETIVGFWTSADRRHHFKIFKPAAEIVEDDLPPSWMKDALLVQDVLGCECC